jgi:hypothetical protein
MPLNMSGAFHSEKKQIISSSLPYLIVEVEVCPLLYPFSNRPDP